MTETTDQPAGENIDDMWAQAMSESQANSEAAAAEAKPNGGSDVFKPLAQEPASSSVLPRDIEMIMDIPVTLTVELGRTRLTIKELLEMAQGHVISLTAMAGEPMDIFINNHLFGQGEVVVHEHQYGIRITEIVTPSERIKKLNKK